MVADGRALRHDSERVHPRPGHRPDRGHDGSGARHVVQQAGRVSERRGQRHSAASRASKRSCRPSAARRRRRSAARTSARSSFTSSRAPRSQRAGQRDHRRSCVPSSRRFPACRCTCRIRRSSASADRSARACISIRCSRRIGTRSRRPRARCRAALTGMPGIEDLTSDLEVTNPQVNVNIDRDMAAAMGVTASEVENAFYDAYGPRWVSTIYAPTNEYKVLLELAPQFQTQPSSLSMLYFKSTAGRARAARHPDQRQDGRRAAVRQSQRPAAGGDRSRSAWRQARRSATSRASVRRSRDATLPDGVTGEFQGSASSVPEFARQSRRAARHRHPGRLHRAGRAVRKLHPPDHDSVRPAVGRRGRAAHADDFPDGSQHLRVRRHDHAGRHRQEERDHAGRLRARSRA